MCGAAGGQSWAVEIGSSGERGLIDGPFSMTNLNDGAHHPEQDIVTGALIARYFPVVIYRIPIYRQPYHAVRTMVVPLLICDFGTILVFRMRMLPPPHSNYNDRISTLVTVLLALFAFLTFARAGLPDVPVSTWMDQIIFQSIVMTCLGMLETVLAYETLHVLEPQSFSNATSGDDDSDDTRRRLVAKGGGASSTYSSADSDVYEVFWPRGGEDDWMGTDVAIWCHTMLRFLTFAFVSVLWVSMVVRLYCRLFGFWRMVKVNDDLLKTESEEVKRKSTDFDPLAYGWPESAEFTKNVADAYSFGASPEKDGGRAHSFRVSPGMGSPRRGRFGVFPFSPNSSGQTDAGPIECASPGRRLFAPGDAQPQTEKKRFPPPGTIAKRRRSAMHGMLEAESNERPSTGAVVEHRPPVAETKQEEDAKEEEIDAGSVCQIRHAASARHMPSHPAAGSDAGATFLSSGLRR